MASPRSHQPVTVRSRMMLEVASELAGVREWPYRQAKVSLREQGGGDWPFTLYASDGPDALTAVADGEAQVAIVNPACLLTMAVRGAGPFKQPSPLRSLLVIPSADQMVFAVKADSGLRSLADLRDRRYPLRVSVRAQRDHSVHLITDAVLGLLGFSVDDIAKWGGEVHYDPGTPGAGRIEMVARGEVDSIFDEAVRGWADRAMALGMRFLPLDENMLKQLEEMGFRRAVVSRAEYRGLPEEVPSLDFSGFAVFTRADAPDDIVTAFCAALEARKDRIPLQDEPSLPLERMVRDTPEGPMDVPLHPAAERFWRERGYLRQAHSQ